jgi:hypothetical protein
MAVVSINETKEERLERNKIQQSTKTSFTKEPTSGTNKITNTKLK